MLIDSHCHLPDDLKKAAEQIKAAEAVGVGKFINIGTSLKDSKDAISTAAHFNEVYAAAAIYPHEDRNITLDEMQRGLELLLKSQKVVAVGECGLDITEWENGRDVSSQKEIFEMQIKLALDYDLPLIIHNRNGDEILVELLEKHACSKLRGVAHCFSSTLQMAETLMKHNFYISYSAMITYPSRRELREVVKMTPLERMLVETDTPYLPPQGHRGEKNEPKYVKIVAQKVAEIKGLPLETIEKSTYENTSRLFRL